MDSATERTGGDLPGTIAAAGVGLWEIDAATGDERWSDRTLALYGLPPGTPAPNRREWRERFLHPDDAERAAARAAHFFDTGEPYELQYRIRRADGHVRWLHTRAAFADRDTERRRVVGMTIDITDLHAQQGEPERRAAEHVEALRREVLARLSHELRTPLNALLGCAQLMNTDAAAPLQEPQRQRAELIEAAGWQLLQLVEAALTEARRRG